MRVWYSTEQEPYKIALIKADSSEKAALLLAQELHKRGTPMAVLSLEEMTEDLVILYDGN